MNRFALQKTDIWAIFGVLLTSAFFGYIAGFRPFGIGLDFVNYQFFYNDIRPNDEFSYFRYEPGFVSLAVGFKNFSGLEYMYFAAAMMTVSLVMKFSVLKRLDHPVLAVIFYLSVWFPLLENTQIRIAFATAFLFLATEKMFNNRWVWFVALSAIASTFHMTAAVAATALVAANFLARYRLSYAIPVIGVSGVALAAGFSFVMTYAVQLQPLLLVEGIETATPNLLSGFNIVAVLFLLSFLASGSAKEHRNRTFFLITCGGFVVLLAFISVPIMAQRFKELFMIFMTFIAFEYRLNLKTLPQAAFASLLAGWTLYSSISSGLFSD